MWDGICGSLDVEMFLIHLLTFHSVQAFSKQLKNKEITMTTLQKRTSYELIKFKNKYPISQWVLYTENVKIKYKTTDLV